MAYDAVLALKLTKARLNRLESDLSLDGYLELRIKAADAELGRAGIRLDENSMDDTMLLADYVADGHLRRDKDASIPEWLRLKRRERWLKERRAHDSG